MHKLSTLMAKGILVVSRYRPQDRPLGRPCDARESKASILLCYRHCRPDVFCRGALGRGARRLGSGNQQCPQADDGQGRGHATSRQGRCCSRPYPFERPDRARYRDAPRDVDEYVLGGHHGFGVTHDDRLVLPPPSSVIFVLCAASANRASTSVKQPELKPQYSVDADGRHLRCALPFTKGHAAAQCRCCQSPSLQPHHSSTSQPSGHSDSGAVTVERTCSAGS